MRELKRHVKAAIAALESPYAETYQLVEIEGMNLQEAADKQGVTLPALKSRLHRARQSVREYLDAHFASPI
jgi:RNA polymerase sigma-70 factor (ECF subfamily)